MLLHELMEAKSPEAMERDQLRAQMTDLYNQEKDILRSGVRSGQSEGQVRVAAKRYLDKISAGKKVIRDKLSNLERKHAAAGLHRAADKDMLAKRDAETPEEDSAKRSNIQRKGMKRSFELRQEHGGWPGLAKYVHSIAVELTRDDTETLSVEQLAELINMEPRTVYKWLERPDFAKTRKMIPSEY